MSNTVREYKADLEAYISAHYIEPIAEVTADDICNSRVFYEIPEEMLETECLEMAEAECPMMPKAECLMMSEEKCSRFEFDPQDDDSFLELESKLNARIEHLKDTYSEYLMYLIESRGMVPAEVYSKAAVDKKVFSKIKNNVNYHPSKQIAMRLCIGARLNIDDSRDLLARAGYTFSPCDLGDVIFEFFIENEIFSIEDVSWQFEEHGLPSLLDDF